MGFNILADVEGFVISVYFPVQRPVWSVLIIAFCNGVKMHITPKIVFSIAKIRKICGQE